MDTAPSDDLVPGKPRVVGDFVGTASGNVTKWKVQRYGKTPKCPGCSGRLLHSRKGSRHSTECRARISKLYNAEASLPPPAFPWENRSDDTLLAEFSRVRDHVVPGMHKLPIVTVPVGFDSGVMMCSDHFFQYERLRTPRFGRLSAFESWQRLDVNSRILEGCAKAKARGDRNRSHFSPLRALKFMYHPPSQFPPILALRIYLFFGAQHVFDPYAGWGDRCLAAMLCGCQYHGIDSNKHLKEPFENMISFFTSEPRYKISDGSKAICIQAGHKAEDVCKEGDRLDFDFVFSSPPFFRTGGDFAKDESTREDTVIEAYHGCETNLQKFMKESLIPVVQFCLKTKPDAWVCLYMPPDMKRLLEKAVGPCRMKLPIHTHVGGRACDGADAESTVYCWHASFGSDARKLCAKLKKIAASGMGKQDTSKLPVSGLPPPANRRQRCCLNCGQLGHFAKTCPNRSSEQE